MAADNATVALRRRVLELAKTASEDKLRGVIALLSLQEYAGSVSV
jgi:hypothetical protein